MNDKEKEVMAFKNGEEPGKEIVLFEQDMAVVIARAEKQVKILERVFQIAIKRTNHYDWVDQQGKPYLTSSGAEKLMPLFGINLTDTSCEKNFSDDDKGRSYVYRYTGKFSWQGGSLEALGACSSRDKFFAWDSKEQAYKPLSEVDETNIMKAAYSNLMVNGITRLLGIRNLTWEQLKEFGIDKEKVAKVEYGGRHASPEETKKQNEIAKMCLEMAYNDKKKALSYLKTFTEFTGKNGEKVEGVDSNRRLFGKRLEIAYAVIKKEYENWKAQGGSHENTPPNGSGE